MALATKKHKKHKTLAKSAEGRKEARGARALGENLWNPVGVRQYGGSVTQRALRDTGLWSLTPLALEQDDGAEGASYGIAGTR